MLVKNIRIPVVIVTASDASDTLVESTSLGVERVLQKPIQPKRLTDTVFQILKRRGLNPQPMGVESHETKFSHEDLMKRAIELANTNAQSRRGGPFGAIIANSEGKILGEGSNGITSRSDPTAHAEVMAIRQASEKLGTSDLSDCTLYISSEPTMMGKALILSVGIPKVYYGLSHEDIKEIRLREEKVREELTSNKPAETKFDQLCHNEAKAMFQSWQNLSDKVAD